VAGQAQLSQVALHLLLLGALDVVLGRVLQVSLDLLAGGEERIREGKANKWYWMCGWLQAQHGKYVLNVHFK